MRIIILLPVIIIFSIVSQAKDIKICSDNDWLPYTYVKDKQALGIHIDIVKKTMSNLNHKVTFYPLPWKRCLKYIQIGKMDALVSASYKNDRASFAYYPDDANSSIKSFQRIGQVEFSLVTRVDEQYIFGGNLSTIPQPVGVGLGSAIGSKLVKKNIIIQEQKTQNSLLTMLINNRLNSSILNSIEAENFSLKNRFKDKLQIHKIPIETKSYHIIFSKKSNINKIERKEIWDELVKVRNNDEFIQKTLNFYIN